MNDEFYIGWEAKAAPGIGKTVRKAVVVALALALLVPVVLAVSQRMIGVSVFEWGNHKTFSGILRSTPYPHLLVPRPGNVGRAPLADARNTGSVKNLSPGRRAVTLRIRLHVLNVVRDVVSALKRLCRLSTVEPMKCFNHQTSEAIAVCAYCGRSLCAACIPSATAARIVCSSECETGLARDAKAVQLLLDKSAQSARASAFYCYLCSALSAGAAIAAWYMLPSPFLIYFTAACALVLFAAGFWYGRVARKQNPDQLDD